MKIPDNTKFSIKDEKFTVKHIEGDENSYQILREEGDLSIPVDELEIILVQVGVDLDNLPAAGEVVGVSSES